MKGMELLKEDLAEFRYSPALLGIHGAISYSDALRVGLGSAGLSSDDHQSASRDLRNLLADRRYQKLQGIHHLERLLARKSRIAYDSESVEETDIKSIVQQAERFASWAEITGKTLRIEGWGDD